MDPSAEEPKVSKRAAEKEAKKAAAKAAKASSKAAAPTKPAAGPVAAVEPVDPFKQGWLKGVYNEKPVPHVRTRFPPEPNGYLHIGHAKAITVNFGFAKSYGGVCNLRYDDTNPAKEEERYFTSILEMVRWLGFEPDRVTYSSDEFDKLYELAEKLIEKGGAYMCYCAPAEIKRRKGKLPGGQHGPRSVCEHWHYSVEKNLEEFRAMRDGKYEAGEAHLRMKQLLAVPPEEYEVNDDDAPNIKKAAAQLRSLAENPAFWDVAAYRIKKENHHHRTGLKWRIYPTYEFTHCICDALEEITHSLCTVEFETLRPAYNWLLEELDIKSRGTDDLGPMQREYGRLNVEGTILSKRRIAMLVEGCTLSTEVESKPAEDELAEDVAEMNLAEDGDEQPEEVAPTNAPASGASSRKIPSVVFDWDDPRLFTLVALRRRGIPPGALKKFVLDLGVTKANANTMTHTLDAVVRSYLERTVPRLALVLDPIKVTFTNLADDYTEERDVPFDPKDKEKGTHKVSFAKTIYIERDDFREADDVDFFRLSPNQSVGLLNAEHPIRCLSFEKDPTTGKVTEIKAEYSKEVPAGKSRIHWVAESPAHSIPIRAEVRVFNPLFNSAKPNELDWKTGGYYDNVNPESLVVYKDAVVERGFREVQERAPWPREEGEAKGTKDKSGVRFQGLRSAFFCEDKESTKDKLVLNRIVSLREDVGKK